MNIRKRFIAYIMCYVLALSMIPAPVSGADGDGAGTETCEHKYEVSKYVWGYETEDVWKDLLVVASAQSPNDTDSDANESWEDKTIQCKAVLVCALCRDEYDETVSAKISVDKKETFPATCQKGGKTTYIASFNNQLCKEQKVGKETSVDPTAHKYGEPTWTWNPNGDGYAATAVFKCTNNNCDDEQSETGEVTSVITKEASCIEDGIKTYKATVTFGGKDYEGSKTDKIEKTGHNYGQPIWSWNPNGDSYDAEASFTCNKCDEQTTDHIVTLQDDDVIIEEEITEASTCMKQGTKTYVASVIFEEQEYKDTEGIKQLLPLSGHNTQKMSEARPATCIADGTIEYYYCKTCKKHFSDKSGTHELSNGSWIIKAKDHQISDHLQPSTNSENGSLIRSCDVCGLIQEKFPIPKKKMKIEIGEELSAQFDDAMDSSKCTFALKNKKDKKYFKLNKNTGKISVQEKYYAKISKKPIVVNVSTGAGTYPVKVTPQIPAPKVKAKDIVAKKEGDYYRFTFKYKIKKADKVKVRCNLKGIKKEVFDRYLSDPICTSDSYIYLKVGKQKKITFTITAYYGKNVSNTAKIQVPIKK